MPPTRSGFNFFWDKARFCYPCRLHCLGVFHGQRGFDLSVVHSNFNHRSATLPVFVQLKGPQDLSDIAAEYLSHHTYLDLCLNAFTNLLESAAQILRDARHEQSIIPLFHNLFLYEVAVHGGIFGNTEFDCPHCGELPAIRVNDPMGEGQVRCHARGSSVTSVFSSRQRRLVSGRLPVW